MKILNLRRLSSKMTLSVLAAFVGFMAAIAPGLTQSSAPTAAPAPNFDFPNHCPRLYYEEPHNSNRLVPQGCPPNTFTQQRLPGNNSVSSSPLGNSANRSVSNSVPSNLVENSTRNSALETQAQMNRDSSNSSGNASPNSTPNSTPSLSGDSIPNTLPLPQEQQPPVTRIEPTNGLVNVRILNQTNAPVSYQVIGDTNQRLLTGRSDANLQNLRTPVTVTVRRQDGGLLKVQPQVIGAGILQVTLNETTNLNNDRGAIQIQSSGDVFLN